MEKNYRDENYLERKLMQEIYKNNQDGDEQMQLTVEELNQIVDQIVGIAKNNNQQQQQPKKNLNSSNPQQHNNDNQQNDKTQQWIKEEETEFFNANLKQLGLCEKKGLDGLEMLYPIENKQKKLEKEELDNMLSRLYVKKEKKDPHFHMNQKTKQYMREQQEKMKLNPVRKSNQSNNASVNISNTTKKSKKNNDNFEQMILF